MLNFLRTPNQIDPDTQTTLLELYRSYVNDEHVMINSIYKSLNFYSGLCTSIIAGAFYVLLAHKNNNLSPIIVISAGILIFFIASTGYKSCQSNYKRQLESIVKRFKIEALLNLDEEPYIHKKYYVSEGLLLKRYEDTNMKFKTSSDFVRDKMDAGFVRIAKMLFIAYKVAGIFIALIGLYQIVFPILPNTIQFISIIF